MSWFSDNYITNNVAVDEIKLIAIVLVTVTVLAVVYAGFKAYHHHMKSVVKNVTAKEIKLNNLA